MPLTRVVVYDDLQYRKGRLLDYGRHRPGERSGAVVHI